MKNEEDKLKVCICRAPGDFTVGEIEISKIFNVKWDQISGGVKKRQGGYSLYGYIEYSLAVKLVNCSGMHDFGYNYAKICIPESINKSEEYREGYRILKKEAGSKPTGSIKKNRPVNGMPCTKRILKEIDKEGVVTRKALRDKLHEEGYRIKTICNAINSLRKQNKICVTGSPNSPKQIIRRQNTSEEM